MSEFFKGKKTLRGFGRLDFEEANGEACSLQESSAARDEALIWLGVDNPWPKVFRPHRGGWSDMPRPKLLPDENLLCSGRMHLTQSQVAELMPVLQRFVDTGIVTLEDEDEGMTEAQQPFNGIRVRREPGRVLVELGDGATELVAALDPVGARRIGMAILDYAAQVAREAAEQSEGGDA